MPYADKEKAKEHKRNYYQENKVYFAGKNRQWRLDNIEKVKKNVRDYYDNHKQEAINTAKRWKNRNPLKVKDGNKIYRFKNKDKRREYNRKYNQEHKIERKKLAEKYKERKNLQASLYRKLHPERAREYVNYRRKVDIQFKLRAALRHRIYLAIKNNFKGGSAVKSLGCSIEELKIHLEKKFQPGMGWDNWTYKGWHVDHVKPLANFNLTDKNQFDEACHYTNLQPLWWRENIVKSNKIL